MISVYQKNSISLKFVYQNENIPIDISNYSVIFIVKNKNDNTNNDDLSLIKKEINIIDGTDGIILINLLSSDTNLKYGLYDYELRISNNNVVKTLLKDDFEIKRSIIKN